MEPNNPSLTKSKETIIKNALKNADQIASLKANKVEDIVAPKDDNKTTSKADQANEPIKQKKSEPKKSKAQTTTDHKKSSHKHHKADQEIFETLKSLEDKIVMSFSKILDLMHQKHFNMVNFLKDEVFHHLDQHHHKLKHHVEHLDASKEA